MFPHVSDDACRGLKMEQSALVRRVRLIYDPSRAELLLRPMFFGLSGAHCDDHVERCSISSPSFSRLS